MNHADRWLLTFIWIEAKHQLLSTYIFATRTGSNLFCHFLNNKIKLQDTDLLIAFVSLLNVCAWRTLRGLLNTLRLIYIYKHHFIVHLAWLINLTISVFTAIKISIYTSTHMFLSPFETWLWTSLLLMVGGTYRYIKSFIWWYTLYMI